MHLDASQVLAVLSQVPQVSTVPVGEAQTWVTFLKEAGGWGIAVLMGFVVVVLWRENKAKDAKIFSLLEKTNEIILNAARDLGAGK
jgi:hypothetical protein